MFQKTGGKYAKTLNFADGKKYSFGKTELRFSEAVPHGSEDHLLGWVIMVTVDCLGERFMHAPDVQGPMAQHTAQLIIAEKPDLLMLGGPPFYLSGIKVSEAHLQRAVENLATIVKYVPVTLLEHHFLRDDQWQKYLEIIRSAADGVGGKVMTAANYLGKENVFLEARRKQLYSDYPPSNEFLRWTRKSRERISHIKPPLRF
jgi:predicted metallo-beta-lactamase superfamily hydrolase